MADITMCKGETKDGEVCEARHICYRYTAKPCEYMQSYFVDPPFEPKTQECKAFWAIERKK